MDVSEVFLKDETMNPSGTYKDRFATLALSMEASRGTATVCLGSAGNAASAIATNVLPGDIPVEIELLIALKG